MEWVIVLALILLGVILIVIEIIFIPGTTIVGIIGFAIAGFGVYLGYVNFGSNIGTVILLVSLFLCGIALVVALKSGVWKKLSLEKTNESKVNQEFKIGLQIDQKGVAVSALRPVGKAEFNDTEYEVQTIGDYIDAGTSIKIIMIKDRKIFVEPIK